jgi:hypothetical protein
VDLNHDNEMGARTESIRDQALPTAGHVDMTPTPFDGELDGPSGEIATPLPSRLIVSAGMPKRGLRERNLPSPLVRRTPDNGAESPMLVMDPALSINPHGTRLRAV